MNGPKTTDTNPYLIGQAQNRNSYSLQTLPKNTSKFKIHLQNQFKEREIVDDIKLNKWANKEALGISPLKFGKFIMVSNEERNSRNANKLPPDHFLTVND